ncbi:hypothetical protein [Magnetospira sp. QH-2]|uniref:hypothetical protein n=1 Tax=Magnetospira sp. (strain QH-2) TaxID=1288970 RepID=UPI0003E8158C|nr:hypothetical protein [Magnetospira sp. QH-2]CCQ75131.1 conserved protein of unknown function [Magnetospira sp. QH-2]
MSTPRNDKALVTVIIGDDDYFKFWDENVRPSWQDYGARYGYDIIPIRDYLDPSPRGTERTPNWQKLLILEHPEVARYDRVVWLDTDILINHHLAPCVVSRVPADHVGLVSSRAHDLTVHIKRSVGRVTSLDDMVAETYRAAGLDESVSDWANTGVMVLTPARHAAVLRHVYDTYEENPNSAKEELPLSNHLYGAHPVTALDKRFNWPWIYHIFERYSFLLLDEFRGDIRLVTLCVNTAWADSWFMHFTNDRPLSRHHLRLVMRDKTIGQAYVAIKQALG